MTTDRKLLISRVYSEAYNAGDPAVLDEVYAESYVRHQPPLQAIEGLEAYRQFVADVRGAYSGLDFKVEEIIEEGDRTVTRLVLRGTHTGKAPTILAAPTGKQVEMAGCTISHWVDEKIAVDWVYNDYLGLVQQFGLYPPPGMFA